MSVVRNGNGNGTFRRPCDGPITSEAGPRYELYKAGIGAFPYHYGIDIGGLFGWRVRAAWNGTIVRIYGSGNDQRIIIRHNGFLTSYLHLSATSVQVGQKVKAGHVIGRVGTAGSGPHLHFEIHPGTVWNGVHTASIAEANRWIQGTRTDASSNPPGGHTVAGGTQTTPKKPKEPKMKPSDFFHTRLTSHITGRSIVFADMVRDTQRKAHNAPRQTWLTGVTSLVSGAKTNMSNIVRWTQVYANNADIRTRRIEQQNEAILEALATLEELQGGQGKIKQLIADLPDAIEITGLEDVADRLQVTVKEAEALEADTVEEPPVENEED